MGVFLMPSLGADMEAGTLVEQLKKPGDEIHHGDVIAVVETQKGAIEIEAFEDGTLGDWKVDVGERVPVGMPLTTIGEVDIADLDRSVNNSVSTPKSLEKPDSRFQPAINDKLPSTNQVEPPPSRQPTKHDERLHISPAARRLAADSNLDLHEIVIKGTGPEGSISLVDIESYLRNSPTKETERAVRSGYDFSAMRTAIAAAMARSKREIPHYYLSHTIDLENAETYVAEQNEAASPENRLVLAALLMKAVINSLAKFPEFNGFFENDIHVASTAIHAGMAVNIRGGGLVAPAILNAQNMNLNTLMGAMRDLVNRVRAGRFRASELSDATVTISSMGDRGVDSLFGVIYPPQVAIVGFGTPVMKPLIIEDKIEARTTVTVTLAADHRVSDGHRGGLFLRKIEQLLQRPEAL